MKRLAPDWGTTFAKDLPDKGLAQNMLKKKKKVSSSMKTIQFKKSDTSPKKMHKQIL